MDAKCIELKYMESIREARKRVENGFRVTDEEKRNKLRKLFSDHDTKCANDLIDAILTEFCCGFWDRGAANE
jgi:predicted DNA-binding protein (UPF0278 family)